MNTEKWKVTAIVFIVLFVVETIIFIALYWEGARMIEREYACADFCDQAGSMSYYYDHLAEHCYCDNTDPPVALKTPIAQLEANEEVGK